MMDQSSIRRFSSGVPVRANRRGEGIEWIARVCLAEGFLMFWASSSTTRPQATLERLSRSRWARA